VVSVEKLLASPHWHLRDMAARTIVSLRSTHELSDSALRLLRVGHGTHNLQHGTLLTVKYTLRKLFADVESLGKSIPPTRMTPCPAHYYLKLPKTNYQ
jgi:hypothetical protein